MHPADTLTQIVLDRHRERTELAHRRDSSSTRVRLASALRRAADRLDAGRPADVTFRHPDPLRSL